MPEHRDDPDSVRGSNTQQSPLGHWRRSITYEARLRQFRNQSYATS